MAPLAGVNGYFSDVASVEDRFDDLVSWVIWSISFASRLCRSEPDWNRLNAPLPLVWSLGGGPYIPACPAPSGGLGISSLPLLADSAKLSDSAVRNCFSVLSVLFPAAVFNLPDSSDMTLLNLSGSDVWSCCICSMN